jgi:hypothetical protein
MAELPALCAVSRPRCKNPCDGQTRVGLKSRTKRTTTTGHADLSYRRLARRYSQMARTTAATRTTTPTLTAARPAAPRAVPIPPNRCPCLRRLALNDASIVTSDKVNTSNPSRRCTKRTGCDPECRGFESRHSPRRGVPLRPEGTLDAAGLALTAGGGSAHLELESARLRHVADCADGDTDHLPQDVAAEQSNLTADIATDAHLGSTTESFIHAFKAKSVTGRWNGGALSRRVERELGC